MAVMPEFRTVRLIPRSLWPPNYLQSAQPGDLFLTEEIEDRSGGFLKIKKAAVFVTLTSNQVWAGKFVKWPREAEGIKGFCVQGNRVVFESM
jgi:hypothetical protein